MRVSVRCVLEGCGTNLWMALQVCQQLCQIWVHGKQQQLAFESLHQEHFVVQERFSAKVGMDQGGIVLEG